MESRCLLFVQVTVRKFLAISLLLSITSETVNTVRPILLFFIYYLKASLKLASLTQDDKLDTIKIFHDLRRSKRQFSLKIPLFQRSKH